MMMETLKRRMVREMALRMKALRKKGMKVVKGRMGVEAMRRMVRVRKMTLKMKALRRMVRMRKMTPKPKAPQGVGMKAAMRKTTLRTEDGAGLGAASGAHPSAFLPPLPPPPPPPP